jgi:hypothetical protein
MRRGGPTRPAGLLLAIAVGVLTLTAGPALVERPPDPVPPAAAAVAGKLPAGAADHAPKVVPDVLAPFRGLSSWIDTYDTGLTPDEQVAAAAAGGVQTLFVQSSRQSTDGLLHDRDRLVRTIDLAHDAGIAVVLWTIPDLEDLDLDRARAIAAIELTTPRGDTADGFGLDIEVDDIGFVPVRNRRLLQLSEELRAHAGPGHPMAAIVLPPLQLELNTTWWPQFPYAELAAHYDVVVPMSYSSYRGADADTTYRWNLDNVLRVRELAGDPDLPVHLAGGIADALPELDAFVQAARDGVVVGAGLYDLHTTRPEAWEHLRALRHVDDDA